ncbi:MAG: hypothetical protein WKF65_08965 [Gaiellaceae bacterium]
MRADLFAWFGLRSPDLPLRGLTAIAETRRTLDEVERLLIVTARTDGWTWVDIGAAMGTTRHAARRRAAWIAQAPGRE